MSLDEKLSTVIEQGRQTIEELKRINRTLERIEKLLKDLKKEK